MAIPSLVRSVLLTNISTFAEYRTYKTYPYKIKRYANFQWDCITMPAGTKGDNLSQVETLLMGISSSTGEEELAWEFLKLLTYDEAESKISPPLEQTASFQS